MHGFPAPLMLATALSIGALLAAPGGIPDGSGANPSRTGNWLSARISVFRARTLEWRGALEKDTSAFAGTRLKAELDTLRRLYKAMEPAAETLQPQTMDLFNGAPLDKVDRENKSEVVIRPPQGLQVLEEEVYRDGAPPDRARIRLLIKQMGAAADQLLGLMESHPADDALLWEAAENEVTRVLAMGISGFDTPASGNGLAESGAAVRSLRGLLAPYRNRLDAIDKRIWPQLEGRIGAAARRLEAAPDFDGFDRLDFLRREGNPLFASLVSARISLGLGRNGSLPGASKADRARPIPERAIDPRAKGLFDSAFLDKEFYALDHDGRRRETPSFLAADLGRRLFFDPILSGDNRRACASCHHPAEAYAEPLARSAAFRSSGGLPNPSTGDRNAPGLVYAAYQASQFWDLRSNILEDQIGHVVHGSLEFNTTYPEIQAKIAGIPEYKLAFARAFPAAASKPITQSTITSALAQYVRSLAGWNSPFDRYARGETHDLDPAARRGFNLFMGKAACGTCHFPPSFSGTVPPLYRETESEVLGVPASDDTLSPVLDPDPGRYAVRPAAPWKNAFKTPTVRNAALTAPFMHNGQLPTLESVVRFYNVGGGRGMGLDVPNQTLPPDSLGLSAGEQRDLIAFMKSLTDSPLKVHGPGVLPASAERPDLAARPPGGEY